MSPPFTPASAVMAPTRSPGVTPALRPREMKIRVTGPLGFSRRDCLRCEPPVRSPESPPRLPDSRFPLGSSSRASRSRSSSARSVPCVLSCAMAKRAAATSRGSRSISSSLTTERYGSNRDCASASLSRASTAPRVRCMRSWRTSVVVGRRSTGIGLRNNFSIEVSSRFSRGSTRLSATPSRPARPTRPMR